MEAASGVDTSGDGGSYSYLNAAESGPAGLWFAAQEAHKEAERARLLDKTRPIYLEGEDDLGSPEFIGGGLGGGTSHFEVDLTGGRGGGGGSGSSSFDQGSGASGVPPKAAAAVRASDGGRRLMMMSPPKRQEQQEPFTFKGSVGQWSERGTPAAAASAASAESAASSSRSRSGSSTGKQKRKRATKMWALPPGLPERLEQLVHSCPLWLLITEDLIGLNYCLVHGDGAKIRQLRERMARYKEKHPELSSMTVPSDGVIKKA